MKLIVGLGNPGKEYEGTRHNAGFIMIDEFARIHNADFKLELKFRGMVAQFNHNGEKVLLLKPQTYMNLSGESVNLILKFYKINIEDLIIISDDLDSHSGRVRLRSAGSAGGHNGLKSIINYIGTNFNRIKIGIDRSNVIPVVDYVLTRFSNSEMIEINNAKDIVVKALDEFISGVDFNKIASTYSTK